MGRRVTAIFVAESRQGKHTVLDTDEELIVVFPYGTERVGMRFDRLIITFRHNSERQAHWIRRNRMGLKPDGLLIETF